MPKRARNTHIGTAPVQSGGGASGQDSLRMRRLVVAGNDPRASDPVRGQLIEEVDISVASQAEWRMSSDNEPIGSSTRRRV
jgi:hypothetical protein